MFAIFRHKYDHRIKHICKNKVKAVKERTHRILYWFGVTLHPVRTQVQISFQKQSLQLHPQFQGHKVHPPDSQSSR